MGKHTTTPRRRRAAPANTPPAPLPATHRGAPLGEGLIVGADLRLWVDLRGVFDPAVGSVLRCALGHTWEEAAAIYLRVLKVLHRSTLSQGSGWPWVALDLYGTEVVVDTYTAQCPGGLR